MQINEPMGVKTKLREHKLINGVDWRWASNGVSKGVKQGLGAFEVSSQVLLLRRSV